MRNTVISTAPLRIERGGAAADLRKRRGRMIPAVDPGQDGRVVVVMMVMDVDTRVGATSSTKLSLALELTEEAQLLS